jgi:phosphoribosylanthranilate isomerase
MPPFVDRVGVFQDEEIDVIKEIVHYCHLTLVQLHGSESPEYCQKISCKVIKSFSISSESTSEELTAYADAASGILLDTYHKHMAGRTGKTFDWNLVEQVKPPGPQVKPFAVDVNSGVEYQPGRKDPDKLKRFVHEVLKADEQASKAGTPFLG